jgi:hypothetical protein
LPPGSSHSVPISNILFRRPERPFRRKRGLLGRDCARESRITKRRSGFRGFEFGRADCCFKNYSIVFWG